VGLVTLFGALFAALLVTLFGPPLFAVLFVALLAALFLAAVLVGERGARGRDEGSTEQGNVEEAIQMFVHAFLRRTGS
jgi:hypothetical protein